jgi:hypothetical protein
MDEHERPAPGDACPECGDGVLEIYSGHRNGVLHVRYVRCKSCKCKPAHNRLIVAANTIKRRRPRKSSVLRTDSASFAVEQIATS